MATGDMDATVRSWPPVTDPFTEDEKVIVPGEGSETFKVRK